MTFRTFTLLIGGGIGLFLAVFGAAMLVTGRAPASTLRNFTGVRPAAMYHLIFGLALLLLTLSLSLFTSPANVVVSVLAFILAGIAVVRYRPRRGKPGEDL
jgi:ABC-type spermidine/putrescine transport system permease subunit II